METLYHTLNSIKDTETVTCEISSAYTKIHKRDGGSVDRCVRTSLVHLLALVPQRHEW